MYGNLARQYEPQNDLQREFKAKNEILGSRFIEISLQEYLDLIFPNKEEFVIVLGSIKDKEGNITEKGTITRIKFEEIWDIVWRSNAYIPYCDFKRNYYLSKTLEAVRAFVNDCDGVTSTGLNKVLKYLWASLPAEPTHVVNSGKGVHFVYALDKPQPVKDWRWSVNKLNETIQGAFSKLLEVDKHPVVHSYRFPGFMTKINTTATVFEVRKPYTIEDLMNLFKISPPRKRGSQTQGDARGGKKKGQGRVMYLPNGKRAFFEWVLRRLFNNPPIPGRRHNSFFALGIIAYKCKREVPYEEAVETIPMVYEDMMDKNLHIGFSIDEAYKALEKGYNPKAVTATWEYLCGLLAWEYRPNKRNGRKREDHLKIARQIRALYQKAKKEEKEEHIKRLLASGYTKTEIAKIIGVSRQNLYKTYGHLMGD